MTNSSLKLVERLDYLTVKKFLKLLGWEEFPKDFRKMSVLMKTVNGRDYQVEVPKYRELCDYNSAMVRVIATLAETMGREPEAALYNLLYTVADVVRLRIADEDKKDGTIDFNEAIDLYSTLKRMVTSASMDGRKVFGKKTDRIATAISKACRLGQTEAGSYVVNLVCPLINANSSDEKTISLFEIDEENQYSTTRLAVNQLICSTQDIKNAIDKDDYSKILSQGPESEYYVSSSFIESLSKTGIAREGSSISISIRYAIAIQGNTIDNPSVELSHDYYEPLNVLASRLMHNTQKATEYVGRVYVLSANGDPIRRQSGRIKIKYIDENGKSKTSTFTLTNDDYMLAVEAHKQGKYVKLIIDECGSKEMQRCVSIEVL